MFLSAACAPVETCPSDLLVEVAGTVEAPEGGSLSSAYIRLHAGDDLLARNDASLPDEQCAPVEQALEDAATAPFRFEAVDVGAVVLALVASVDDGDGGALARTFSTVAPALDLSGEPLLDRSALAVGNDTVDALASAASAAAEDLLEAGLLMVRINDEESGSPVEGVVLLDSEGFPAEGAYYPNPDLSALQPDETTSSSGLVFVKGAELQVYTGQKEGLSFDLLQAAAYPDGVTVAEVAARPR